MSTSPTLAPLALLSDGTKLPIFGLGTWKMATQEEMTNLLRKALDLGYRHIDTAIIYENQKMIGEALRIIFTEGKYKREDLYIVSKIIPYHETNTLDEIKQTLKDLQINYVDLLYQHWPYIASKGENGIYNQKPIHVQWAQLEEVHSLGLTKSLGVSNFNVQTLVDLLSYAKVKPVSNQIELHVFLQQPQLVNFCKRAGIQVTAYSPMARFNDIVNNNVLKEIAEKHSATISQVLLQFLLQNGIVVIPRTTNFSRLKENFDSLHLKLTPQDITALQALDKGFRICDPQQMDYFEKLPLFH